MAPSLNVFQLLPLPQVLKDSLQTHLSNPLNLVLFLLALYLIALSIPTSPPSIPHPLPSTPSSYNWRPKQAATGILWRSWTPEQLHGYDGTEGGKEDGRILFAIRRKVYDVTSGKNFYGPGGPYEIFAGRDASRGLAKQSFDADMLSDLSGPIDTLEDLTKADWENLKDWEGHFDNKYIQCGDYVEP